MDTPSFTPANTTGFNTFGAAPDYAATPAAPPPAPESKQLPPSVIVSWVDDMEKQGRGAEESTIQYYNAIRRETGNEDILDKRKARDFFIARGMLSPEEARGLKLQSEQGWNLDNDFDTWVYNNHAKPYIDAARGQLAESKAVEGTLQKLIDNAHTLPSVAALDIALNKESLSPASKQALLLTVSRPLVEANNAINVLAGQAENMNSVGFYQAAATLRDGLSPLAQSFYDENFRKAIKSNQTGIGRIFSKFMESGAMAEEIRAVAGTEREDETRKKFSTAKYLRGLAEEGIAPARGSFASTVESIAENTMKMTPALLVGGGTSLATGNPVAGMLAGTAVGSAMYQSESITGNFLDGQKASTALLSGTSDAIVGAAGDSVLQGVAVAGKLVLPARVLNVASKVTPAISRFVPKSTVGRVALGMGAGAVGETLQEMSEEPINAATSTLIGWLTNDPAAATRKMNTDQFSEPEFWGTTAFLGGLFGGIGGAVNAAKRSGMNPARTDAMVSQMSGLPLSEVQALSPEEKTQAIADNLATRGLDKIPDDITHKAAALINLTDAETLTKLFGFDANSESFQALTPDEKGRFLATVGEVNTEAKLLDLAARITAKEAAPMLNAHGLTVENVQERAAVDDTLFQARAAVALENDLELRSLVESGAVTPDDLASLVEVNAVERGGVVSLVEGKAQLPDLVEELAEAHAKFAFTSGDATPNIIAAQLQQVTGRDLSATDWDAAFQGGNAVAMLPLYEELGRVANAAAAEGAINLPEKLEAIRGVLGSTLSRAADAAQLAEGVRTLRDSGAAPELMNLLTPVKPLGEAVRMESMSAGISARTKNIMLGRLGKAFAKLAAPIKGSEPSAKQKAGRMERVLAEAKSLQDLGVDFPFEEARATATAYAKAAKTLDDLKAQGATDDILDPLRKQLELTEDSFTKIGEEFAGAVNDVLDSAPTLTLEKLQDEQAKESTKALQLAASRAAAEYKAAGKTEEGKRKRALALRASLDELRESATQDIEAAGAEARAHYEELLKSVSAPAGAAEAVISAVRQAVEAKVEAVTQALKSVRVDKGREAARQVAMLRAEVANAFADLKADATLMRVAFGLKGGEDIAAYLEANRRTPDEKIAKLGAVAESDKNQAIRDTRKEERAAKMDMLGKLMARVKETKERERAKASARVKKIRDKIRSRLIAAKEMAEAADKAAFDKFHAKREEFNHFKENDAAMDHPDAAGMLKEKFGIEGASLEDSVAFRLIGFAKSPMLWAQEMRDVLPSLDAGGLQTVIGALRTVAHKSIVSTVEKMQGLTLEATAREFIDLMESRQAHAAIRRAAGSGQSASGHIKLPSGNADQDAAFLAMFGHELGRGENSQLFRDLAFRIMEMPASDAAALIAAANERIASGNVVSPEGVEAAIDALDEGAARRLRGFRTKKKARARKYLAINEANASAEKLADTEIDAEAYANAVAYLEKFASRLDWRANNLTATHVAAYSRLFGEELEALTGAGRISENELHARKLLSAAVQEMTGISGTTKNARLNAAINAAIEDSRKKHGDDDTILSSFARSLEDPFSNLTDVTRALEAEGMTATAKLFTHLLGEDSTKGARRIARDIDKLQRQNEQTVSAILGASAAVDFPAASELRAARDFARSLKRESVTYSPVGGKEATITAEQAVTLWILKFNLHGSKVALQSGITQKVFAEIESQLTPGQKQLGMLLLDYYEANGEEMQLATRGTRYEGTIEAASQRGYSPMSGAIQTGIGAQLQGDSNNTQLVTPTFMKPRVEHSHGLLAPSEIRGALDVMRDHMVETSMFMASLDLRGSVMALQATGLWSQVTDIVAGGSARGRQLRDNVKFLVDAKNPNKDANAYVSEYSGEYAKQKLGGALTSAINSMTAFKNPFVGMLERRYPDKVIATAMRDVMTGDCGGIRTLDIIRAVWNKDFSGIADENLRAVLEAAASRDYDPKHRALDQWARARFEKGISFAGYVTAWGMRPLAWVDSAASAIGWAGVIRAAQLQGLDPATELLDVLTLTAQPSSHVNKPAMFNGGAIVRQVYMFTSEPVKDVRIGMQLMRRGHWKTLGKAYAAAAVANYLAGIVNLMFQEDDDRELDWMKEFGNLALGPILGIPWLGTAIAGMTGLRGSRDWMAPFTYFAAQLATDKNKYEQFRKDVRDMVFLSAEDRMDAVEKTTKSAMLVAALVSVVAGRKKFGLVSEWAAGFMTFFNPLAQVTEAVDTLDAQTGKEELKEARQSIMRKVKKLKE